MKFFTNACKKELQISNCGLHHHPPEEFVKSQWQTRTKSNVFLIYRWIVGLFFVVVTIFSMQKNITLRDWGIWFIYLTHWGVLLCLSTTILGAIIVTTWHFHPEFSENLKEASGMPILFKIYWMLHNSTLVLSIVISLIYWSVLYQGEPIDATNAMTHITNSVLMFIDLLIVAYPIRLMHVIQPIAFGMSYLVFSVIYHFLGGTNMEDKPYIYAVIDWSKPELALSTSAGNLVLAITIHSVLFLIFTLRTFLYEKYFGTQDVAHSIPDSSKNESNQYGQQNTVFTIADEKM